MGAAPLKRFSAGAALAALLLFVPLPAQAHFEEFGADAVFGTEHYVGLLQPVGKQPVAGQPLEWQLTLQVVRNSTLLSAPPETTITYGLARAGASLAGSFRHDANNTWLTTWRFPSSGTWNATLLLDGPDGRESALVPLDVYADVGFRITPVRKDFDPVVGNVSVLEFKLVWYDGARAAANLGPRQVWMTLERWTDDHSQLLGTREVELHRTVDQTWAVGEIFGEPGMRHLRFRGDTFSQDDVPTQHVFVLEAAAVAPGNLRVFLLAAAWTMVVGGSLYLVYRSWLWWKRRYEAKPSAVAQPLRGGFVEPGFVTTASASAGQASESPERAHNHSHNGHGHDGHDLDGHDHGHDHDSNHGSPGSAHSHAHSGAAERALRVDLPVILPQAKSGMDLCNARLRDLLLSRRGILEAHFEGAHGRDTLCIHYDPEAMSLNQLTRAVSQAGIAITKRYAHESLWVTGMGSTDSALDLERVLRRMDGVLEANANYAAERLHLEYDTTRTTSKAILAEIGRLGYKVEDEDVDGHDGHDHAGHEHGDHDHGAAGHQHAHGAGGLRLPIASGVLLAIGYLLQVFYLEGQLGETLSLGFDPHSLFVLVLYAGAYVAGGLDLARHGFKAALRGSFDIEFLMIVAAVGAAILGEWPEGALLLFLFSLGHNLEHMAMGKARNAIKALGKVTPKSAHVVRDGREMEVAVGSLLRGDVVLVRPSERVPVDGTVRKGSTAIDQAPITGESVPVEKEPGSNVFAGTINGDGLIEVEVTRLAKDTTIARVVQMVSEAQTSKGPAQLFTERFGRVFVPIVLVSVVAVWVVPPLLLWAAPGTILASVLGLPMRESFLRSMTILVAASPCALAISTPSAILSGIAQGARKGVLFKGGAHLEALGSVQAIAFDKTGTLTRGHPAVTDVVPMAGTTEMELVSVAASLERRSMHPLAKAVVEHARLRSAPMQEVVGMASVVGRGITGTLGSETVRIGNARLFEGAVPAGIATTVDKLESNGRTTMIVQRGGRFLGVLGVADQPRTEAKETVRRLKAAGVPHLIMLTGDNARVAGAVASQVGVTEVQSDLMPEGKVAAVRDLQRRHGKVAMIGDGVNDAPAMANATVGVAMGAGGTDVALETADVALMADSLAKLPFAMRLSRATRAVIRQNLVVSLGVIAILVPAALFGWAGIGSAIILHEGSTLAVVGNALRLLRVGDSE